MAQESAPPAMPTALDDPAFLARLRAEAITPRPPPDPGRPPRTALKPENRASLVSRSTTTSTTRSTSERETHHGPAGPLRAILFQNSADPYPDPARVLGRFAQISARVD